MPDVDPTRRRAITALIAGASTGVLVPARAQTSASAWPTRPMKVMVGAVPGGPADFLGRLFADSVGPLLGQGMVVENKAGVSGTLAAEAVAKSPPDGYTLLSSGSASMIVAPYLMPGLGYNPISDFVPIALIGAGAFVLVVHPSVPARTVSELIELARERPGSIAYGSGGNGSSGHLTTELFARTAGVKMTHIPYKGDGQAVNDLIAGRIQMMFTAPNVALPQARVERLRAIAVTTTERVPSMAELPTVSESGLSRFESLGWTGLFAPSGTPQAVQDALIGAWARARVQPAVRARLEQLGMLPPERLATPEAFAGFLKTEHARLSALIRDAGIKGE